MNLSGLPDDTDIATGGVNLGGLPDDNARLLRQQYRATQGSPDEAAKSFELARTTGIPKPVIERNRQKIEEIAAEPDWGALEATAPVTVGQLVTNPKMFELARDDTDNMSLLERAVRQVVGPTRSLAAGILTDFNAAAWGLAEGTAKYAGAERLGASFEAMRRQQEALGKRIQGDYGAGGLGEAGVASGFRSFGAMVPGTLASVLTGNPAFMLATGGAQAGGQAVGKGLDIGLPPSRALLYGAQDATAEIVTEMIPVARLFKDLKAGTPFLKLLGHQMATEVPTELAATAWQNFNAWANLNPDKSFETYLNELGPAEAETVIATVTQTILSAGMAKGAARLNQQFEEKRQQATAAEQDAAALQQINALATASKLRARDPQSFEQFVAAASEDGPVQDVYLDARTLQQAGVDMQALAQASPAAAAQVEEALATGGDIVIPVGEYASRVAGGELDPVLTPHLRISEEGLSLDEAQRYMQGMQQEMQQAAQQALAEREADTAWQQSAKAVETELLRQLRQTGRFTNDVNTAYATLMRDFYVATAQRLGLTPTEMYSRYPLQIRAESVAAEQRMNQITPEQVFRTVQPGDVVDGRVVREEVPNMGSISSSLDNYTTLPGVREVPLSAFDPEYINSIKPERLDKRTRDLADQIKASGEINPLIVAFDAEGAYVIEGGHRFDALIASGAKSLPAMVVIDQDNPPTNALNQSGKDQAASDWLKQFLGEDGGQGGTFLQRAVGAVAKAMGIETQTVEQPAVEEAPLRPGGPVLDMGQFFNQPVYHGSPYKFDKFTLDHIGKGEGAQAYGWGLYFAGNREVAEYYRNALKPPTEIRNWRFGSIEMYRRGEYVDYSPRDNSKMAEARAVVAEDFLIHEGDITRAFDEGGIEAVKVKMREVFDTRAEDNDHLKAELKILRGAFERPGGVVFDAKREEGQLYTVDIPEDGNYLLWDKPLSGQPEGVRGALLRAMPELRDQAAQEAKEADDLLAALGQDNGEGANNGLPSTTGEQFYHRLASKMSGRPAVDGMTREEMNAWYERTVGYRPDDDNGSPLPIEQLREMVAGFNGEIIAASDAPEAASKYLNSLGILGIKYLDQASRGQGEGSFNYVIFDDSAIQVLDTMYQEATVQPGNRGEISMARDVSAAPSVISLFKTADLSTLLHEMGHFQLEVLAHIASQPDAPQAIVNDFNAALNWFKPGLTAEEWSQMTLEDKRPYHEQFARGFETYLFEGKAPSAELDSLFHRFRAWLLNVYKSIKALDVEVSDDIRGVFDRLIATEDAIKQAEAVRSYAPLFTEAPPGMDPALWEQYKALGSEATQRAIDDMQRRSLRDMRWLDNARGRILKQLQRDAKDKRKSVETEVRAEVAAEPVWQAKDWLRANKETSLTDDQVAEMFGFTSGDHMRKAIRDAGNREDLIRGMTDQRVLERYGDLANPDTIARAADEAIHNEARARFVATELKALTQAQGPVRAMTKAAKDFAEALIVRKKLRDIKPNQHASAEARAAKAAQKAMAAGDTAQAAAEKRNQLVQNYATRTAYSALDEIDKAVKYLRKFDGEGARKNLDPEYLDQIDQLLERFDLRASTPLNAAKKRANLLAWVESQREQGFEPDIPPDLLSEASRKPYRELTLEEMRGLVDTVKQVEHLGRLKKKLLTAKDEREFQAIRDEIAASIEANAKGTRELRTRNTTGAMLKDAGNRFLAMHRKMASVAREMDGFQDGGPMWEYLIRSMNAAGDRETGMRADATARLYDLVKPLLAGGPLGGKGQYFATLDGSYNREERLAIALNLGNAGNMQRLLDGEGWTLDRLQPLLDTITPEEADFVQAVWDFFESYRPQIAEKETRIYGREPEWVEPQPLALGGKTLRGGYYPIKYDTNRSGRAEQHAEAEEAKQQMRGAYTTATTRRSFTKSRAEEVTGRPLVYSFSGIYQGANEVIHDLSWHEWLIDSNRLVRSLDAPIRLHYGPETVALFKKAIQDIAAGDVPAQNVFEKGINHLRVGSTVAGLGWNLSTALLQPFGLTQSMVRIGPGWVAKGLGQWIKSPLDTGNEVAEKSSFMRDRARTMQREINEIQNQVRGDKLDAVRGTFFLLIQKMQMVADMPTWLGAYEKAIADGNAEDRAVALADQAVVDAQGGGQTKDLAQIQRGGPLLKLWTNFYSFFNTTYNLAVEKTKEKGGNPKLYPSLALDYMLLFVVPSAMVTLMKAALQGDADDEDKLVKKLIADQISYLLGTMIGLREVTAAAQKVAGVEQFKGSYGGPAGLRMLQEIDKLATQSAQGEADTAFFKAANNVAGNLLHYPSGQINRTVEGTAAMIEGKTANPAALVFGPPKP